MQAPEVPSSIAFMLSQEEQCFKMVDYDSIPNPVFRQY